MRSSLLVLALLALVALQPALAEADLELQAEELQSDMELEWIAPVLVETLSEQIPFETPAEKVKWQPPKKTNIDHREHRKVHTTLMAQHLDIANEHSSNGNGVGTLSHVAAAEQHNTAAVLHAKADTDPDFVQPAIKASRAAYTKSRSLLPPQKTENMVPEASQPSAEAKAALSTIQSTKPNLAPEALEDRMLKRFRGK